MLTLRNYRGPLAWIKIHFFCLFNDRFTRRNSASPSFCKNVCHVWPAQSIKQQVIHPSLTFLAKRHWIMAQVKTWFAEKKFYVELDCTVEWCEVWKKTACLRDKCTVRDISCPDAFSSFVFLLLLVYQLLKCCWICCRLLLLQIPTVSSGDISVPSSSRYRNFLSWKLWLIVLAFIRYQQWYVVIK